jgi:hypothetical protein
MNKQLTLESVSGKRKQAAVLVAEDHFTDEVIAEKVGISRATLARWKLKPEFLAMVEQHSDVLTAQALKHGIARREYRVGVLQELHARMLDVVEKRRSPENTTGLLVKTIRTVGWGDSCRVVEEFIFDAKLARAILEFQERCSQELGQEAARKTELSGNFQFTVDRLDRILNDNNAEEPYIEAAR